MTKKANGKLTMELSDYLEVHDKLQRFENAVSVQKRWGDTLEVRFDVSAFKDMIEEMVREQFPEATIKENYLEPGYSYATSAIASLPTEEEEE